MKDERLIVRTMERLGIATAYGNRTQAIDYLNRTSPASCGFVAYNPFMPARVGWENYTIYIGGEDDMLKARILEGELTKWFNVRYEQYPRTSGTHIMMNVSVRAKGHLIGAYMGGGGQQEPDALNFTMPNGGTITLTRKGSPTTVTLEYTLDGGRTWTEWVESGTTRTLTLQAGEKVYIRNTSTSSTGFSTGTSDYYDFAFNDATYGGGNADSLLCKNPNDAVLTPHCYRSLFRYQTNLKLPPQLLADTLAEYCYTTMFQGSGITKAPKLIAEETLSNSYAWMFRDCTDLVDVSEITMPSIVSYNSCSRMFQNSGITESPILRAASLAGNDCYYYMFYNCGNLIKVTTYMESATTYQINTWLGGVAATGDFYCPQSLTITTNSSSGIPTGWTRHDL